jgi:hypothetical protein
MHIFLKQTLTKSELKNRLNISSYTLNQMMQKTPGINVTRNHILSNDEINHFFRFYKFSPKLLSDIAEISEVNYYEND